MTDSRTLRAITISSVALVAMLSAPAALAKPPASSTTTITIHADKPGPQINKNIYGQFSEHLGAGIYGGIWVGEDSTIPNTRGFRNDVIAALKDLHVPVVRWPGGCFGDEYHWREGIGPRAQRSVRVNHNWGGVPEPNAFGTHEFFDFVDLIGADAYVSANVGTGSPQEMADWLEYMVADQDTTLTRLRKANGRDNPWKLSFLAMGNETWGCGGNMRPEYYADIFKQYATFVRTPRGSRPMLIASGGHDDDLSWTTTLMENMHWGTHPANIRWQMDAISFHYYTIPSPTHDWEHKGPSTGFGEDQWMSTLVNTLKMDDYLGKNIAIMNKYDPQEKVGFYVDEWGTWYDPEPGREPGFLYQQNTMRDAVVAGVNFNIFHKYADRVRMANIAQTINVLQAMILTDGPKMVLTPTYHVFHMFIPFQGATSLPTNLSTPRYQYGNASVPEVSVSAARIADGDIDVALVNLDPNRAAQVSVAIAGAKPQQVSGTILTATAMDARNTFDAPDAVHPVAFDDARIVNGRLTLTLPAKSVVVLDVK
jgi:alpha-N-arabinofuranosidase